MSDNKPNLGTCVLSFEKFSEIYVITVIMEIFIKRFHFDFEHGGTDIRLNNKS